MVNAVSNDPATWFILSDENERNILDEIGTNPNFGSESKVKYEAIQLQLLDSASKFKDLSWKEVKKCWDEFKKLRLLSIDDRFVLAYKYDLLAAKCESQAERIKSATIEREKADLIDKIAKERFDKEHNIVEAQTAGEIERNIESRYNDVIPLKEGPGWVYNEWADEEYFDKGPGWVFVGKDVDGDWPFERSGLHCETNGGWYVHIEEDEYDMFLEELRQRNALKEEGCHTAKTS